MVDVEMDCSRTENGWFEIKGFVTNGDGWERDITQVCIYVHICIHAF